MFYWALIRNDGSPHAYPHQKEYARWVTEAKKAETRSARLAKAVEMLRAGVKTPD